MPGHDVPNPTAPPSTSCHAGPRPGIHLRVHATMDAGFKSGMARSPKPWPDAGSHRS